MMIWVGRLATISKSTPRPTRGSEEFMIDFRAKRYLRPFSAAMTPKPRSSRNFVILPYMVLSSHRRRRAGGPDTLAMGRQWRKSVGFAVPGETGFEKLHRTRISALNHQRRARVPPVTATAFGPGI